MKLIKLHDVNIPRIQNNTPPYAARAVPKCAFPLHFRMAIIGGVGRGKTTSLIKILQWYDKSKSFDKCIFFSPTLQGENKGDQFLKAKHNFEISHHSHYSDSVMQEEAEAMKVNIDAWKLWEQKKKVWEKFKKCQDVEEMSLDELQILELMGFNPPQNEFPNGYPSHILVLDDLVGAKGVFSANCRGFLTEFILRSRHYSCSIIILSQVFKNFLPAQLRQGSFDKWVLFGTKSHHKVDIAEEVSDRVDSKTFLDVWDFATQDEHECLVVDYTAAKKQDMFRKGFDTLIQYEELY
jgi:hypothetical protein